MLGGLRGFPLQGRSKGARMCYRRCLILEKTWEKEAKIHSSPTTVISALLWGENPRGPERCLPPFDVQRSGSGFSQSPLCFTLQPAGLSVNASQTRAVQGWAPPATPSASGSPGTGGGCAQWPHYCSLCSQTDAAFLLAAAVAPFQQFPTQHLRRGFMGVLERHFGVRRSYGKGS